MIRLLSVTVFAIASMLTVTANAAEVSGYSKGFFIGVDPNSVGRNDIILDGNVRMRVVCQPCDTMRAEIAYQVDGLLRDKRPPPSSPVSRPQPRQYRLADLDRKLIDPSTDLFVLQNLDRALITCSAPKADINVGRQAIAFGSARGINPTDIITPFTFDTLDQEERIGVDAIRVTIPTGDLSEIDMGLIAGNKLSYRQDAVFVRRRTHLGESDITLIVIHFRENTLLGFDIQRPWGEAGFWFEAAYTFTNSFQPGIRQSNYGRISTGLDYICSDKLYISGEYHYSSAGTNRAGNYGANVNQVAYTQGAVYLLGQHYLIPSFRYEFTPLWILAAQTMINVADPSVYTTLVLEHNLQEDLYLDWGLFVGAGRPASEFQLYSNVAYFSVRYYF